MDLALREARKAYDRGEVPAGCVIVQQPEKAGGLPAAARVLARAHNQTETLHDPTAHAEMIAITQAANALQDWRLNQTVLYVTKEPCPMCAGAIVLARIPCVVFGVPDPRRGGAVSVFQILSSTELNHRAEIVQGVLEEPCREMLTSFFKACRQGAIEKPGRAPAKLR